MNNILLFVIMVVIGCVFNFHFLFTDFNDTLRLGLMAFGCGIQISNLVWGAFIVLKPKEILIKEVNTNEYSL